MVLWVLGVGSDGGLRVNSGSVAAYDGDVRSALLQGESVAEMVVAPDADDVVLGRSGSHSKGYSSKDSVIVEISDTAHQISQGSFLNLVIIFILF